VFEELRQAWTELTSPGGAFEITEVPVRGTPVRTYANAPTSLRDVWLSSRRFGAADHLVYGEERWSFDAAHEEVASVAAWLSQRGVGPGDRVAIAMRNYPEWLLVYWATLSLGATVVGMNAWWTGPEMAYALEDSKPRVLVCDAERLERFEAQRGDFSELTVVTLRLSGDSPDWAVPYSELKGQEGSLPEIAIDPESDACIFYTSGTTGRPKGAQLTHRSCTANIMSIAFWAAVTSRARELSSTSNAAARQTGGGSPRLVSLVTTPLFHVTANNCVAHMNTVSGGTLVFLYKWDASEALRLIEQEHVTNFTGVPTMTRELLAHPNLDDYDLSSLQIMGGGGAAFQPDLVEKVEGRKGNTRPNTGYGLTETSGIVTTTSADHHVAKPDSVGPILPCYEADCFDEAGQRLPRGEVGELRVRGAQVIAGYLNRPEATAEAIQDGWFRTGDIGRIDEEGFLYIVDRIKDMVIRGGENVYSGEVEVVLFDHPDVLECAVFGVPDERLGEEIGAAIHLREGSGTSAAALREFCESRIAAHKIPRYIWFRVEPLPRNANGKFLKRALREELLLEDAV